MNLTIPDHLAVPALHPPATGTPVEVPSLDQRDTRAPPAPVAGSAATSHDKRTRSRQYGARRPRAEPAVAMNVVALDFVEAAKLRGEKTPWIVLREIVPNIMPPLVTEFGLRYCFVFLTISSLSFLGLGMQPPTADWGLMVKETATLITYGDITPLLPAGAIALLTVAINFIVDWFLHKTSGLRDGQ